VEAEENTARKEAFQGWFSSIGKRGHMAENIIVRMEVKNPRVGDELDRVISSTEGFRLEKSDLAKSCDLLILEIGEDLKGEFQLIHSLQHSGTVGTIFLTSPRLEPAVLLEALRAGAKEFFSQPINGEEVRNALLKFRDGRTRTPSSAEKKKKKGKILQVLGSKGGVGVTTAAVNLAAGLAELDRSRSVALVDMNLIFGEIPIFLDIKSSFDWGEVVKNISRVDATLLKSILFKHPCGISVLTSPAGLDGVNRATPEILGKLLEAMQGTFDYTVVDGGQSIDDLSLKALEMSDKVFLVATLSLPCLTNIKRLLWTFEKLGYPGKEKIKIVINRYQKASLISLKEAKESIGHDIFWQIPNDFQTTMAAINQGKVIFEVGNGAEICRSFRELAASILGKAAEKEKGLWSKLVG
jgi:pilus assembly protein CpaE